MALSTQKWRSLTAQTPAAHVTRKADTFGATHLAIAGTVRLQELICPLQATEGSGARSCIVASLSIVVSEDLTIGFRAARSVQCKHRHRVLTEKKLDAAFVRRDQVADC
jgi:hypothetical protein